MAAWDGDAMIVRWKAYTLYGFDEGAVLLLGGQRNSSVYLHVFRLYVFS